MQQPLTAAAEEHPTQQPKAAADTQAVVAEDMRVVVADTAAAAGSKATSTRKPGGEASQLRRFSLTAASGQTQTPHTDRRFRYSLAEEP